MYNYYFLRTYILKYVTSENLVIFQDHPADDISLLLVARYNRNRFSSKRDQFSILNSIRKCGILLDIRQESACSCRGDPCVPLAGFQLILLIEKYLCNSSPPAGMFNYFNRGFSDWGFSCSQMGTDSKLNTLDKQKDKEQKH